jgi:hypothetical protein
MENLSGVATGGVLHSIDPPLSFQSVNPPT